MIEILYLFRSDLVDEWILELCVVMAVVYLNSYSACVARKRWLEKRPCRVDSEFLPVTCPLRRREVSSSIEIYFSSDRTSSRKCLSGVEKEFRSRLFAEEENIRIQVLDERK